MIQPAPIPTAAPPRRSNRRAELYGQLAVAGFVALELDRPKPRTVIRLSANVVNPGFAVWMRRLGGGLFRG